MQPISPDRLARWLGTQILPVEPGHRLRVAVDGAPPARPGALAADVVLALRTAGRPAVHLPAAGFLRPAALRFERGRTDPDAWYEDALDYGGLRREVLGPLGAGGSGQYLPALWDPVRERSPRHPRRPAEPDLVAVVSGTFLLGGVLPFDRTVHLHLSPGALRRRLPAQEHWTLPAYDRYDREVDPAGTADLTVAADDPRHPAIRSKAGQPLA